MRRLSLAAWPIRKSRCKSTHSRPDRRRHQRRLQSEPLEDRRLLAVFTVSNLDDTGAGSLRNALIDANGNGEDDTINFSVSGTIDIMSQLPAITDDVIIDGGNAITLDASVGTGYRLLTIDAPAGAITATLNGLTLSGASNGFEGGAIFFSGADDTLNLNRVTVSDNMGGPGGGLAVRGGTVNIRESTFRGNSGGDGGAMSLHNGNFLIENSTLSGNLSSNNGSSIDHVATGGNSSLLDIKGSTIVTGDLMGNNVNTFVEASSTAETRFQNSIFVAASPVQNVTGGGPGTLALLSLGHNLASDSPASFTAPGDQTNTDPLLGPLANNGGPTQTHALLPGSPALNMGDPSLTGFDQRGAPFLRNDGSGVDIGAYEAQLPALVVSITADENDGDYSPHDLSLREAIVLANANPGADTITFDTLFNIPQTITISSQLPVITDNVTIVGTGANLLTIDAGSGGDGVIGNGDGFRIFQIDDGNEFNQLNVMISDITLTGGDGGVNGGAVFNAENLTITHSAITGNATLSSGGGLYNRGTATIARSTVSGNSATSGGGIFNIGDFFDYVGPGGVLDVIGCTIANNVAFQNGGGIFNTVTALGIGFVALTDSTLTGNSAAVGGGGAYNRGELTVNESTLTGNSANFGGGIENFVGQTYASTTINRSTLSRNFASTDGGGIRNLGDLTVDSSTLSGNSAGMQGGGIRTFRTATISNSIVANSTTGGDVVGTLSGIRNLIEDGSGGLSGTISGDPLLGPLADNGGPTQTHALLSGSPALNMGDPSLTGFDQRGAPFLRNAGGGADIGAFERQTVAGLNLVVDTTADENDGDYTAGDLSLREAIGLANGNVGTDTITFSILFNTPQTIDIKSQLPTITDDVAIVGTGANLLTIDAGGGMDGTIGNGDGFRVFSIFDGTYGNALLDVEISGLTITGGDIGGSGTDGFGGAIFNRENLTLTNSTLSGNAAAYGGGLWNSNYGRATITNSMLSHNLADEGGAIWNDSQLNVIRSSLTFNGANDGGGIWTGKASYFGSTTVSDSTLSVNGANLGGGIFNRGGTLSVNRSVFSENSAFSSGGGIYNGNFTSYGLATITDSTLTNNTASSSGGGIRNAGVLTVNSSTISGNSAVGGGGIAGSATVTSSILANSTGGDFIGYLSGSHNLIEDGSGGLSDTIIADPLLGPLADNGGPTQTLALLSGSPALDMGDPSLTGFDQRGAPFLRNAGGGADIGAFERQTVAGLNLVVDTTADENDGDYTAGDLSLREAIGLANGNVGTDTITFSTLFNTPQTIAITSQLPTIGDAVNIAGTGANLITINAGGGLDGIVGNGDGFRILNIDDGESSIQLDVVLSGLTLTGADTFDVGGAILNRENLTVTASDISGNHGGLGGGICHCQYAEPSNLTLSGSTLSGNSALFAGGGIYNRVGNLTITSSTISGNSTDGRGGGIVNGADSNLTITSSTISGNSALSAGGGIESSGNLTIASSTISGNSAVAGGGIQHIVGNLTITGSTISGNSAYGGGILNGFSITTITNSTISGNSGGGIFVGGTTTIINSTISGNFDGGIVIGPGTATVIGTIVANSLGGGDVIGTLSGAHNLIEDGSGGLSDTIIGDPLLGLLTNNGGPTFTHALLPGSPAIDAGDPTFSPPPDFDQRGAPFVRVFDDPSAPGGGIDIGAYELQTTPSVDPDFNNDGFINGVDIDLLQANIVTGPADPETFDLTGDGLVTVADRDEWLVQAGAANLPSGNAYRLADANLDGVVDGQDFIVWNGNKFTTSSAWTRGDFNVDGVVDGQDFILWNANKFQSADAIRGNAANLRSTVARRHDRIIDQLFARRNEDDDAPKRSRGRDAVMSAIDALFAAYA